MKSRTRAEAAKIHEGNEPLLLRLRLGRLEKARNQRLDLVDCVCVQERIGEIEKNIQFHDGVILLLTQRHA